MQNVLSEDEAADAACSYRQHRLNIAAERAAMWRNPSQHLAQGTAACLANSENYDLERLLPAPGFVSICGILLPCRPGASGHKAAHLWPGPKPNESDSHTVGALVKTAAMFCSMKAAALALCQQRPIVFEGPPGNLCHCQRAPISQR